jgi:hypothetical protein
MVIVGKCRKKFAGQRAEAEGEEARGTVRSSAQDNRQRVTRHHEDQGPADPSDLWVFRAKFLFFNFKFDVCTSIWSCKNEIRGSSSSSIHKRWGVHRR